MKDQARERLLANDQKPDSYEPFDYANYGHLLGTPGDNYSATDIVFGNLKSNLNSFVGDAQEFGGTLFNSDELRKKALNNAEYAKNVKPVYKEIQATDNYLDYLTDSRGAISDVVSSVARNPVSSALSLLATVVGASATAGAGSVPAAIAARGGVFAAKQLAKKAVQKFATVVGSQAASAFTENALNYSEETRRLRAEGVSEDEIANRLGKYLLSTVTPQMAQEIGVDVLTAYLPGGALTKTLGHMALNAMGEVPNEINQDYQIERVSGREYDWSQAPETALRTATSALIQGAPGGLAFGKSVLDRNKAITDYGNQFGLSSDQIQQLIKAPKRQSPLATLDEDLFTLKEGVQVGKAAPHTTDAIIGLGQLYKEIYGKPMYVTSITDGDMHVVGDEGTHSSGDKFDIADDVLEADPEKRAMFIAEAQRRFGIKIKDEYSDPSANSTAGHLDIDARGFQFGERIDPNAEQEINLDEEQVPIVDRLLNDPDYTLTPDDARTMTYEELSSIDQDTLQDWGQDKKGKPYSANARTINNEIAWWTSEGPQKLKNLDRVGNTIVNGQYVLSDEKLQAWLDNPSINAETKNKIENLFNERLEQRERQRAEAEQGYQQLWPDEQTAGRKFGRLPENQTGKKQRTIEKPNYQAVAGSYEFTRPNFTQAQRPGTEVVPRQQQPNAVSTGQGNAIHVQKLIENILKAKNQQQLDQILSQIKSESWKRKLSGLKYNDTPITELLENMIHDRSKGSAIDVDTIPEGPSRQLNAPIRMLNAPQQQSVSEQQNIQSVEPTVENTATATPLEVGQINDAIVPPQNEESPSTEASTAPQTITTKYGTKRRIKPVRTKTQEVINDTKEAKLRPDAAKEVYEDQYGNKRIAIFDKRESKKSPTIVADKKGKNAKRVKQQEATVQAAPQADVQAVAQPVVAEPAVSEKPVKYGQSNLKPKTIKNLSDKQLTEKLAHPERYTKATYEALQAEEEARKNKPEEKQEPKETPPVEASKITDADLPSLSDEEFDALSEKTKAELKEMGISPEAVTEEFDRRYPPESPETAAAEPAVSEKPVETNDSPIQAATAETTASSEPEIKHGNVSLTAKTIQKAKLKDIIKWLKKDAYYTKETIDAILEKKAQLEANGNEIDVNKITNKDLSALSDEEFDALHEKTDEELKEMGISPDAVVKEFDRRHQTEDIYKEEQEERDQQLAQKIQDALQKERAIEESKKKRQKIIAQAKEKIQSLEQELNKLLKKKIGKETAKKITQLDEEIDSLYFRLRLKRKIDPSVSKDVSFAAYLLQNKKGAVSSPIQYEEGPIGELQKRADDLLAKISKIEDKYDFSNEDITHPEEVVEEHNKLIQEHDEVLSELEKLRAEETAQSKEAEESELENRIAAVKIGIDNLNKLIKEESNNGKDKAVINRLKEKLKMSTQELVWLKNKQKQENAPVKNNISFNAETHGYTTESVVKAAKEAYGATNVETSKYDNKDALIVTLKDGSKRTIILGYVPKPTAEAVKAHGVNPNEKVTATAAMDTKKGIMYLNERIQKGDIDHEVYHDVKANFMTAEEVDFLDRHFPGEENQAKDYANWVNKRRSEKGLRSLWSKLTDFIAKGANMVGLLNKQGIYAQVMDSSVFSREQRGNPRLIDYLMNSISEKIPANLKEWFGNSKGTNPDGTPKIFFRKERTAFPSGKVANWDVFDPKKAELGFHAGFGPDSANEIGKFDGKDDVEYVRPFIAKYTNPLLMSTDLGDWHPESIVYGIKKHKDYENDIRKSLKDSGVSSEKIDGFINWAKSQTFDDTIYAAEDKTEELNLRLKARNELVNKLKELGFDAIQYPNKTEYDKNKTIKDYMAMSDNDRHNYVIQDGKVFPKSLILFDKNQMKLADNNLRWTGREFGELLKNNKSVDVAIDPNKKFSGKPNINYSLKVGEEQSNQNEKSQNVRLSPKTQSVLDRNPNVNKFTLKKTVTNLPNNATFISELEKAGWKKVVDKEGNVSISRTATPFRDTTVTATGGIYNSKDKVQSRKEQLKNALWDLKVKYVDDLAGINKVFNAFNMNQKGQDVVDKAQYLINTASNRASYALEEGGKYTITKDGVTKTVDVKGILDVQEALSKSKEKAKDFSQYLYARRIQDLVKLGKKTPMSLEQSNKVIKEYIAKNPEFKDYGDRLTQQLNMQLAWLRDSGLVSNDSFNYWVEKHPNYTPYEIADLTKEAGSIDSFLAGVNNKSFSNISNPIKTMTGHEEAVFVKDPYVEAVKRASVFSQLASRQEIAAKVRDAHLPKEVMEKVHPERAVGNPNTVYIWNNGKKEYFIVNPALKSAINNLDRNSANLFLTILRGSVNSYKAMTTGLLDFGGTNVSRDSLSAWFIDRAGFVPIYDTLRGIYNIAKNTKTYREYKRMGGIKETEFSNLLFNKSSGALTKDPNLAERLLSFVMNTKWSPLRFARKANDLLEAANRVAVFDLHAKELEGPTFVHGYLNRLNAAIHGKSISADPKVLEKAMLKSMRELIDFRRAGTITRSANKYFPFVNAFVQGWDLHFDNMIKNPIDIAMKTAIFGLISATVAVNFADDDEIKEEQQYIKDRFWVMRAGDSIVRIPLPQEIPALTNVAVQHMLGKTSDKQLRTALKDILTPTMLPPMFNALYGMYSNYDSFGDRTIEGKYDDTKPAMLRYSKSTSEGAKWLGASALARYISADGVSPKKIDFLARALGGRLMPDVLKIPEYFTDDKMARPWNEHALLGFNMPGRFFATPLRSPQSVHDFWENSEEITKLRALRNAGEDVPNYKESVYNQLHKYDTKIRKLYKSAAAAAENPKLSPEQKRKVHDEWIAKAVVEARKANKIYEDWKNGK